ncbi:MAG: hypothetical protein QM744_16370 [Mesorhizobium sp.]
MARPIYLYKLTPVQIALVDRLVAAEGRIAMERLEYREVVAYQELSKLGFTDLQVGRRQKLWVVLTESGYKVRNSGYFSKKPVLRLTEPQINLLRYLDDGPAEDSVGHPLNDIPHTMIDVCRRMSLRGWVERTEGWNGVYWVKLTDEGRAILMALDATHN